MGSISMVYTHQLLGFTCNFSGSQRNNLRRSLTLSPVAGISSGFIEGSKIRRKPSSFPSISPSHTRHLCKSQLVNDFAPVASAGYAVLLLGGGLFAYNKSGSKGSLFGGLTGAALMSAAYYLMQSSETKELGDAVAFGASLLFASVFGIRLAATRKLIPAGFLLGVSIVLTVVTYSAYMQDKSLM